MGVVPRDGVHRPLRACWNSSLRHIGSIKPEICSISPDKALLTNEVQWHLLETFLSEVAALGTQSVLVASSVVGSDGPGDIDLGADIPGEGSWTWRGLSLGLI